MTKAAAIRRIAEGLYELADALFAESAVGEASAGVPAAPAAISKAAIPEEFEEVVEELFPPQGSLAQCPSHKARYQAGKYGPYCPAKSDEPAWANRKGYCTITPDTAAEWLRQHAA